ncbi:hypothetical protein V5O48_009619 [Marasmius crinis-equi]|uniref:Uncharacterized protein n=1 Tax=Marasmius crinis-equi TaxID=585013 RepID=A0ABR3FAR3_9AGAR
MESASLPHPQVINLTYREKLRRFLAHAEEKEARANSRPWYLSQNLEDSLQNTFAQVKFQWEDLDGAQWGQEGASRISISSSASSSIDSKDTVAALEASPVVFSSSGSNVLVERTNESSLGTHNSQLSFARTTSFQKFGLDEDESSRILSRFISINSHSSTDENTFPRTPAPTPRPKLIRTKSYRQLDTLASDFEESPELSDKRDDTPASFSFCSGSIFARQVPEDENADCDPPRDRCQTPMGWARMHIPGSFEDDFEDDGNEWTLGRSNYS